MPNGRPDARRATGAGQGGDHTEPAPKEDDAVLAASAMPTTGPAANSRAASSHGSPKQEIT